VDGVQGCWPGTHRRHEKERMKLYRLHRAQRLPVSVEKAWEFFSDPRNLQRITPQSLGLRLLSGFERGAMYPGMILVFRVRPFLGIPVTWVTEITHVDEPRLFVDEQRFGPYRFWHHKHLFRPVPGGVEVEDLVDYALPPVPFSGVANRFLVGARLAEIFDYRRRVLEQLFGSLGGPDSG